MKSEAPPPKDFFGDAYNKNHFNVIVNDMIISTFSKCDRMFYFPKQGIARKEFSNIFTIQCNCLHNIQTLV